MVKNKEIQKSFLKDKLVFILEFLVIILVIMNLWTFFSYVPKNMDLSTKKVNDNYKFLNPARKLVDKKDLIINIQPLRDYLDNEYKMDSNVSIYFEYLPTGANIAINKDADFFPASLLKVPVAMAAAKKIEKGDWKWDNKLVLMAGDKDDKFGDLYKEPTGSIFTIEELIRRSLGDSDNTANLILLRNLELAEINDVYEHMGLQGFLETDGSISAKRYSVILRTLYSSSYLKDESSQKILSCLASKSFMEYLGSALPENVILAHKIGIDTKKKIYSDSGIIYLEKRPYALVVMTKSKTDEQAREIMKDISKKVFNYVKNYNE